MRLLICIFCLVSSGLSWAEDHFEVVHLDSVTSEPESVAIVDCTNPVSLAVSHKRQVVIVELGVGRKQPEAFVVSPNGRHHLTSAQRVSWSPGASRIAVSRLHPEPGVWLMSAERRSEQLLDRAGRHAVWSSDGRAIAYAREVDGSQAIVVHDLYEADYDVVWTKPDSKNSGVMPLAWDHVGKCLMLARPDSENGCRVFVHGHADSSAEPTELSIPESALQQLSGGWVDGIPVVLAAGPDSKGSLYAFINKKWRRQLELEKLSPVALTCRQDGLYLLRPAEH